MIAALHRWLDRRRLRDARFLPLFERYRGEDVVSLDLETTSLDPAECEVLSLAAVPIDARGARLSERFVRSVRHGRDYGIESIRVHRILPGESAGGASLDAVIEELRCGWATDRCSVTTWLSTSPWSTACCSACTASVCRTGRSNSLSAIWPRCRCARAKLNPICAWTPSPRPWASR